MSSVEILIADDRELFRRMARSLVESQPGYHICGEAGDGIEAIEKVRQLLWLRENKLVELTRKAS
jgi:DNA-binding NarL/FixJ family response regulator